jgi:diadenosine tetraphosphatase ApaH/serine/threonine PP2A family protein phosphatase
VTLVHGSPRKPIWEYVMDLYTARVNMDAFSTQICLVGHTHIPCIFEQDADHLQSMQLIMMEEGEPFVVERKCIVNPGSVGQPRDHDPRASYMLYDDETGQWNYHRVEYDIPQVQQRIRSAGLPYRHASRLKDGW